MKEIYENHLFSHNLFVSSGEQDEATRGYVLFSLLKMFAIRIKDGWELASENMIRTCQHFLNAYVSEPFYRGFPHSVRRLAPDLLFLDQLIHYIKINGLHFLEDSSHSIFEEIPVRTVFSEDFEYRDFSIITEAEAKARIDRDVRDLMSGTRPLSEGQFRLVAEYVSDHGIGDMVCGSKSTAVRLLMVTRDLAFVRFLSLPDVIRLAEYMNFYGGFGIHIDNLNLKNRDRKLITDTLDILLEGATDFTHCYDKKKAWCGLLHHIHYKAKTPEAQAFLDAMRGRENHSVYSEFESALSAGDMISAVDILLKGKGPSALIRCMNRLLTLAKTDEEVAYILDRTVTRKPLPLLQFYTKLYFGESEKPRVFSYPRFGRMVNHYEDQEQADKRHLVSDKIRRMAMDRIMDNIADLYRNRLGKVYIDPDMSLIALPMNESASQSGYGIMPKGSVVRFDDPGKIFRAFLYWERVNDIDLSAIGVYEDGRQREFSWRSMSMQQCNGITFSGDIVNGYNGGCEYYDIDLEEFGNLFPGIEYLVFNANVYSDYIPFKDCYCRVGYMSRDSVQSGEIYEPKTVKTSFIIDADSRFAHMMALDLRRMRIVWLNTANESMESVAGRVDHSYLRKYLSAVDIMNWEKFFSMLATERVYDPALADVIVSDKEEDRIQGKELIRSSDVERVIALMN